MPQHMSRAEIVARKKKRLEEGEGNMARYLEQQQRTLDKTVRLRALRLAHSRTAEAAQRSAVVKNTDHRRVLPATKPGA
jgi:hypothetical protein